MREEAPASDARSVELLAALSAAVAAGEQDRAEAAARALAGRVQRRAAEEAVLQTYLFAGFPAAINGFAALERGWPREGADGREPARQVSAAATGETERRRRGEVLCALVYGPRYDRLRATMARLSPELDDWMVVEGYGKTLSRDGLDGASRELCAVAALAALGAWRQLDSHLEGARRLGADPALAAGVARESAGLCRRPGARERVEALVARAVARARRAGAREGGEGAPARESEAAP